MEMQSKSGQSITRRSRSVTQSWIFWGKAKEGWLRTMLRDLNKVFGLGRTGPYKAASLYLSELPDATKESFRTREVSVIRPDGDSQPGVLRPFVAQLSGA